MGSRTNPSNETFGAWLLCKNMDQNLLTNIGNINYCNEEKKVDVLIAITEKFCDNTMVIKITDGRDCESLGNMKLTEGAVGAFNRYIRSAFRGLTLTRHGVRAKLPVCLEGRGNISWPAKQIAANDLKEIRRKYQNPIVAPYKVELADAKIETVLCKLPDIFKYLAQEHYYLLDFDITQDFAGIFNKAEMISYLKSNFDNFCYPGEYANKDVGNVCRFVDNNSSVGIDCLTWWNSNARIKIYNKFI